MCMCGTQLDGNLPSSIKKTTQTITVGFNERDRSIGAEKLKVDTWENPTIQG